MSEKKNNHLKILKNKDHNNALNFLLNRIRDKTGISKQKAIDVIGCIADLSWDWNNSEYDLMGLDIENLLNEFGKQRKSKHDT